MLGLEEQVQKGSTIARHLQKRSGLARQSLAGLPSKQSQLQTPMWKLLVLTVWQMGKGILPILKTVSYWRLSPSSYSHEETI